MYQKIILPLINEDKTKPNFFYNDDKLDELKEELEEFLDDPFNRYMNNIEFAESFMGCQEIKSNNSIEGYQDDVQTIMKVIGNHHEFSSLNKNREKVIGNLYNGYREVLKNPEINSKNLKKLYDILSNGLLSEEDLSNMGTYYRQGPVYIFYSKLITASPDEGVSYKIVEQCMESLFDYLNSNDNVNCLTDYFIKSQIAHYYFVHVHPFFDVNGRTSRTLGMWYLLNNKAYPYIIFNRAIPFTINKYYKIIRDTNKFRNITFFLAYMMENIKIELEKEHVISQINENINSQLTENDYQTLLYILSMKGIKTCKDYTTFYNRLNENKRIFTVRDEMLMPLIDKDILKVVRNTKSCFSDGMANFVFEINPKLIDSDPSKIKRLKI